MGPIQELEPLRRWLETTSVSHLMTGTRWAWPAAESIHFFGLAMMVGCVGLFDLRLMGMAKRMSPIAVYKLIPWGLAGFAMDLVTGIAFLCGTPDQYFYNEAFWWKVAFLLTAGLNAGLFYLTQFSEVRRLPAGADAPMAARWIGAISLACWVGVMAAGRLLTFYRPIPT
jgi:hypothetical protein